MTIDTFYTPNYRNSQYSDVPKSNFYLGMVSQVYRDSSYVQVENLSLFNHRNIRLEKLIPNSINYFVVIDSVGGLFLGEIYQSRINSSDSVHDSMNRGIKESIYPEIAINIIGILDENTSKFKLPGLKTVGITDKVYIANKKLISLYLNSIELNDYKSRDENGDLIKQQDSLENLLKLDGPDGESLSLRPNTLLDRHLMVIGTTNSGKSTSSLRILDKLISQEKKILILDPTGEYSDAFNNTEMDKMTLGNDVFLKTSDVDDQFWIDFFSVSGPEDSNKASVLSDAIASLRYQKSQGENKALKKDKRPVNNLMSAINDVKSKDFDLPLLPDQIRNESVKQVFEKGQLEFKKDGTLFNASTWLIQKVTYFLKSSLINQFFRYEEHETKTNLFEKLKSFINPDVHKSLYLNLSTISKNDTAGHTIVDLIATFIMNNKTDNESALVIFIDETHRYINRHSEENGLISISREGRKKGIFLFLTTQNPKDIPEILLGQIGTIIIHRLTHYSEISAIQNYLNPNVVSQIPKLHQGEAILTSINLIQDIHVYFEKTTRPHHNNTPFL